MGRHLDVILHIGAHRTGTTSLQGWLLQNEDALRGCAVACWGPDRTRAGLFAGLIKRPDAITAEDERQARRSVTRIRMEMDRLRDAGCTRLIVSEENILGSMLNNIDMLTLYPDARARLDRFAEAFDGTVTGLVLAMRRYDLWWSSVLSTGLGRGADLPDAASLDRVAHHPRGWSRLVDVLAEAFPGVRRSVWPFEALAGQAQAQVQGLIGGPLPAGLYLPARPRNASPGPAALAALAAARGQALPSGPADAGRWMPFSPSQRALMATRYDHDLAVLRNRAGQGITLVENAAESTGEHPGAVAEEEGTPHDRQKRGLG